jgi:protein transport protein SEC24
MSNSVEPDYFCTLDASGKRRDVMNRPELSLGSVDFLASAEYCNRPPMAPAVMFAIDVSVTAVRGGLLHATVQAIRDIIEVLGRPGRDERTKVGIITFDSVVHFYNLATDVDGDIPGMAVLGDIEDPFLATTSSLVCLKDKKHNIIKLLDALPGLFQNTQVGEAAAGAAVRAASLALASNGGRVICCFASPPTLGIGKLARLDDQAAIGTNRETKLYSVDCKFYKDLAVECCQTQVSVDFFACTGLYCDLASMSAICRDTGGQLHYLPRFGQDNGASFYKLIAEVTRSATRTSGYEAVLRVRCSQGLAVHHHLGSFHKTVEGDIEFPAIDSDKALCVTFKIDSDITDRKDAAIQCALLYTAQDGSRRIRVHTISIPVTDSISTIFKSADLDCVISTMAKQSVVESLKYSIESSRADIFKKCVQMLFIYRKYCATNPAPGQLILPESLKLLPLYTLAMMKCKVLNLKPLNPKL